MTMAGVPPGVVAEHKPYLSNMLGLIRGNIYYNLVSWYRCLTCLPVGDTSKYMETMMGVKQVRENVAQNTHMYMYHKVTFLCVSYTHYHIQVKWRLHLPSLMCNTQIIFQEARFD